MGKDSEQLSDKVQAAHLDTFLPFILRSLSQHDSTVLKIEGLHTLTQVALQYSQKSSIKKHHVDSVCKTVSTLLDDKKRAVRKFARTCINEWQTNQ